MLVCAIALLLIAVLVVMFHFSRATLREEAMHDAQHTLESTSVHIDNILLSVELTAGNFYYDLSPDGFHSAWSAGLRRLLAHSFLIDQHHQQ